MFIRSLAVATNLFWAGVFSVTVPRMVGALGNIGAFIFYAGLNILSFVLTCLVRRIFFFFLTTLF
jgi:hypothetical protein